MDAGPAVEPVAPLAVEPVALLAVDTVDQVSLTFSGQHRAFRRC